MSIKNSLSKIITSAYFRVGLGLTVSILSLYLASREIKIQDVRAAIIQTETGFLLIAFISVCVNILVKALRWHVLLGSSAFAVSFIKVMMSFTSAQMLNAFFPARVGEISRVHVMGAKGPGHAFVLGTVAVEKVLDMVAYAFLFLILLLSIPLPNWMGSSGYMFVFLTFLITTCVIYATIRRDWIPSVLGRMLQRISNKFQEFIINQVQLGFSSLNVLKNRSDLIKLAFTTSLVWSTALLTNYLVLLAFGIQISILAVVLILVSLQAGISIPSLPGRIGIFEYICILALGVFGVDRSVAFSYGILLHVVVYFPIILLGLPSYWGLYYSESRLRSPINHGTIDEKGKDS
jgi:uncharacterized protein (TIRG00374 family)